ncbi:MAG TPA: hydantoinase/oxoprolinase family protein [bacterium]|nr:hydantoinase/oxoprolinase family protein [bacterium]
MANGLESNKDYMVGIDTGGTFTDITVLTRTGELFLNKAATTPHDFSQGILNAVEEVAKSMGTTPGELLRRISLFKQGSTVATNALITRSGGKVGFITTKGFEDTTLVMRAIGRADGLPEMEIKHVTKVTKPDPIVPRRLIRGVCERIDFAGQILIPINREDAEKAVRFLVEEEKVDSIAVSLLFSWLNPAHELVVMDLIRKLYPGNGLYVTLSHQLSPVAGEYARANTAIINCYLGPLVQKYVDGLDHRLKTSGFEGTLMVMQANGGIVHKDQVTAVGNLQSGPAGGMIATSYMASLLGHGNVISTDMGGTSFDVGIFTDGYWHYAREPIAQRYRILQPMIDIESIGAGGGTIAYVDSSTGRLMVGPRSAGASPGPVCYDEGGKEVTVTDANVLLGLIEPDYFLGGRKRLNREKAARAMEEQIAVPLGLSTVEAAAGIYDVINSKMSDLIRKQVVRAGHEPEEYVIYSFGGAGPVHAEAYAVELGIERIYIFPTSAVFSAFGIVTADVIHTLMNTHRVWMPADPADLNAKLDEMEGALMTTMEREGFKRDQVSFRRTFFMRYKRQVNDVPVLCPFDRFTPERVAELQTLFNRSYEDLYGEGASFAQAGSEIIAIHVDIIGATPKPSLKKFPLAGADASTALKGQRRVYFSGAVRNYMETAIYDYQRLRPGNRIKGPAIVEAPITTVVISPKREAEVDEYLNIVIRL